MEGGSAGSSDPPFTPSTLTISDTRAALQSEAQAYAELWNNGGDIGRVIAVAAIAARIAAIIDDRPTSTADMARVSLVSGAFARSVNSLTEAATRGEISLTDGTSPYAMVSRVAARHSTAPGVTKPLQELESDRELPEVINPVNIENQCITQRQLRGNYTPEQISSLVHYDNVCDFQVRCDWLRERTAEMYPISFQSLQRNDAGYPRDGVLSNCRRDN